MVVNLPITAVKTVTSSIFYLILFLIMLSACQVHSTQRSSTVALINEDFKSIELDSDTANACSPDLSHDPDFIGIAINVPSEVEFNPSKPADDGSFTVIPICGFYQIGLLELRQDSVIQLFALNTETQQVYRGELVEEDFGTDEPFPFEVPEPEPEEIEGQVLAAYFNPNFVRFVKLPVVEAKYKILVQIGKLKSNVVEVELKLIKD